MRKIFISLACLIFISYYACETPVKTNALEYNNFLIKSIDPVVARMVDFEDAVYTDDLHKLENTRKDFKQFVAKLKNEINEKKAFDGNEKFKDAALEMLNFYNAVSERQYQTIVKLKANDKRLNDETVEQIEDIISEIYYKEHALYEKFEAEARIFAEKYGIESNFIYKP